MTHTCSSTNRSRRVFKRGRTNPYRKATRVLSSTADSPATSRKRKCGSRRSTSSRGYREIRLQTWIHRLVERTLQTVFSVSSQWAVTSRGFLDCSLPRARCRLPGQQSLPPMRRLPSEPSAASLRYLMSSPRFSGRTGHAKSDSRQCSRTSSPNWDSVMTRRVTRARRPFPTRFAVATNRRCGRSSVDCLPEIQIQIEMETETETKTKTRAERATTPPRAARSTRPVRVSKMGSCSCSIGSGSSRPSRHTDRNRPLSRATPSLSVAMG